MNLFNELKRRNVFRIAGIYAVVGWILMQVAGTLEASLKLPEWFDSVITAGLLIGFPISLLFAWAFEMTPEGVKPTELLSEDQVLLPSSKKMDGLILIGIVAVLGMGAWQQLNNDSGDSATDKNTDQSIINQKISPMLDRSNGIKDEEIISPNSIAVLPFTDLSQAGDQEYFSDGMAEEILNVLVQVKQLKVASRTSAFGFKGQESLGIPDIAKKLKVRHILEGSVRKSGDNIRITAQLIDAQNDKHLWSQTYDRRLTTENIFAIQDEISRNIVEKLGIVLDIKNSLFSESNRRVETQNLAAYELYLRARALFQKRINLDKAEEYITGAIKKDDRFAKAWELRAALQMVLIDYGFSNMSYQTMLDNTLEFANKALAINPNSALAMAAIANSRETLAWTQKIPQDYQQIIGGLERSLAIAPNQTSPNNWLGLAYLSIGEQEKALKIFNQCIAIDPSFAPCIENKYDVLAALGRYNEAWEVFTDSQLQGITTGYWTNFILLAQRNEKTAFVLLANTPERLLGWSRQEEVYQAYQDLNDDHSALINDILQYLEANHRDISIELQSFLLPLGAYQLTAAPYAIWGKDYPNYRQSKYFKQQIKGAGIFDYWQKSGYPSQCRPIEKNDFECD